MKNFVILNAAPGQQIKSYGPKCLLKLNDGSTLIERQTRLIRQNFKNANIICVGGFEFNKLDKHITDIDHLLHVEHYDTTNTLYSLGYALYKLDLKDCFVMHGDLIFQDNFFNGVIGGKTSKIYTCDRPQGGVQCNSIKNNVNFMMWYIDKSLNYWSEFSWICEEDCLYIKKMLKDRITHRLFLFEAFNQIAQFRPIKEIYLNTCSVDVDKTSDLKKGNNIVGLL